MRFCIASWPCARRLAVFPAVHGAETIRALCAGRRGGLPVSWGCLLAGAPDHPRRAPHHLFRLRCGLYRLSADVQRRPAPRGTAAFVTVPSRCAWRSLPCSTPRHGWSGPGCGSTICSGGFPCWFWPCTAPCWRIKGCPRPGAAYFSHGWSCWSSVRPPSWQEACAAWRAPLCTVLWVLALGQLAFLLKGTGSLKRLSVPAWALLTFFCECASFLAQGAVYYGFQVVTMICFVCAASVGREGGRGASCGLICCWPASWGRCWPFSC